ncbi:MAG: AraC family transcriptional regulator [Pseudomonadota bacterium]
MTEWHTTITIFVVAQLCLLSILFLKHRPYQHNQTIVAVLLISVIAYLVLGSKFESQLDSNARAVLALFALLPPYLLWVFVIRVFEVDIAGANKAALIVLLPVGIWIGSLVVPAPNNAILFDVHRIASIAVLVHSIVATVSGRSADLLEQRRKYRLWFVLLIAVQAMAVLLVELAYPENDIPIALRLLSVATIGLLTVGLSLPLLRLEWTWLAKKPEPVSGQARDSNSLERRLHELMQDDYFKTTGLSIGQLAAQLQVPEYKLRRQINTDMGFRNFNAYLNSYRLGAAAEALADREQDRKPILSIALELGFASIGPFNRAFKQAYGKTPSQFRQQSR